MVGVGRTTVGERRLGSGRVVAAPLAAEAGVEAQVQVLAFTEGDLAEDAFERHAGLLHDSPGTNVLHLGAGLDAVEAEHREAEAEQLADGLRHEAQAPIRPGEGVADFAANAGDDAGMEAARAEELAVSTVLDTPSAGAAPGGARGKLAARLEGVVRGPAGVLGHHGV